MTITINSKFKGSNMRLELTTSRCKCEGHIIETTSSSRKQNVVAKSSIKIEYWALSQAASELLYLLSLFSEIRVTLAALLIVITPHWFFGREPCFSLTRST
ncbi:hypothetical protein ACOSQ2_004137 [Xanthoceras sorbifolium]